MQVVALVFPHMTQLDLTGPLEVFSRFKELSIHLAWKSLDPVKSGGGLPIMPTVDFASCPQADILFVPGGPGQLALMDDAETLEFIRRQAGGAHYITSVCTGSLILASAGLLTGYRATCHWMSLAQLSYFGAEPVAERVVEDRDRITGAGVTSGIDFALLLTARIFGIERARLVQLSMEYDPKPPFTGGSPASANPGEAERLLDAVRDFNHKREVAAKKAAEALRANSTTG
ncbi:MAG TPA: DJ-1/PfpI family protein [Burkholderiales bacterium]|nr:DJ-1/PfpI family protein [Burkholderiales bacterium]